MRQHTGVVRDVGGVAEAVVVLVVAAVVLVGPAAQAEPRRPLAHRFDTEEEVGDEEAVDAVIPGAGMGGHDAQPRVADVAHVVLVVEVEAGDGEVNARAREVDGEVVRAVMAVERAAAAQGVVGGGEQAEEGRAEVAAGEALEGLPSDFTKGSEDATTFDALEKGAEALPGTGAGLTGDATQRDQTAALLLPG